ncbi:PQQ-dependent sugar dehydrogenase [Parahaliea sp. F7430]|uniref:PQQ-dependent sugar dehydrogenase n=1 Tax=Sediminihaliea albiluteola TaxID=2758564 RepID=A0A7W2TX05_9GAMM|nr:PQQ-dependent sugar dehydrogenase [Sediminihaliea albiluteola]MBA6413473.1 PQQ-dependent sugar dehydrogenase [Sediminihaliea albiluteola]
MSKFRPKTALIKLGPLRATVLALCLFCPLSWATEYQLETLRNDLQHPWSVVQLPDHSFLVSERGGRVLHIPADGSSSRALQGIPEPYVAGQGGLFDLALHPQFEHNRTVYLSYAKGNAKENATAVIRGQLSASGLENVEQILVVKDPKDTPQHYAARLLFLPDTTLLVTTGDGFDYREQAQNLDSELGKVLRINDDGSVPSDNPFVDSARPRIFSYGHRNAQGLALDADSGDIYLHEHGPKGGDELNLLQAGANYGWPAVTYGVDYNGAYVSPFKSLPGMQAPLHYWVPSIAPSGMAWYKGHRFPQWQGDLFIGALVNKEVRQLKIKDGLVTAEQALFSELKARIRDVYSAPDGYLYLLTDSEQGALIRVRPAADK